jgi:hypothetical protein
MLKTLSDTIGARLSPEAPQGTPEATSKVAPNEIAKPVLVSRGRKNFKMVIGRNRVDQAARVISCGVATTGAPRFGFGRKTLPAGKSSAPTLTRPDVATILIGGQRSRTNRASFRPSIEPGIGMSVKTTWIAGRGPKGA